MSLARRVNFVWRASCRRDGNEGAGGRGGKERAAPVHPSTPMSRLVVGRSGGQRHITVRPSAAGVTSREHTVTRAHTHAQTYKAAVARRPTHITEFPPPTVRRRIQLCSGRGGGGGNEKTHTTRARRAAHSPVRLLPVCWPQVPALVPLAHHTAAARRRRRYSFAP